MIRAADVSDSAVCYRRNLLRRHTVSMGQLVASGGEHVGRGIQIDA